MKVADSISFSCFCCSKSQRLLLHLTRRESQEVVQQQQQHKFYYNFWNCNYNSPITFISSTFGVCIYIFLFCQQQIQQQCQCQLVGAWSSLAAGLSHPVYLLKSGVYNCKGETLWHTFKFRFFVFVSNFFFNFSVHFVAVSCGDCDSAKWRSANWICTKQTPVRYTKLVELIEMPTPAAIPMFALLLVMPQSLKRQWAK